MLTGTLHSSLWQAHSSTHGMHSPDIDLSDPDATVQVDQVSGMAAEGRGTRVAERGVARRASRVAGSCAWSG